MDIFAPYRKINGCFVVLNVANPPKTIRIFNNPINSGQTRDILAIYGVAEDDIRASLLKGELNHKIRAGEIVITCSDIDLLQFNANQKTFLQGAGITTGLEVSTSQLTSNFRIEMVLVGALNSINTVFTLPPPDVYFLETTTYKITVYKNGIRQLLNVDFTPVESGGTGTGFDEVVFALPPDSTDSITADYYVNNP